MGRPSFFARLWLAIVCWFRIVFDAEFAGRVQQLREPEAPAALPPQPATLPAPAPLAKSAPALHLLSILQRDGRLVDFCQEELAGFSDAQVGAAARTVHEGCRKALQEAFSFAPIRAESEGTPVELQGGFDPRAVRLTGNVAGNPPFRGVLRHHGWKATEARMPESSGDPAIIAPAEVELP